MPNRKGERAVGEPPQCLRPADSAEEKRICDAHESKQNGVLPAETRDRCAVLRDGVRTQAGGENLQVGKCGRDFQTVLFEQIDIIALCIVKTVRRYDIQMTV